MRSFLDRWTRQLVRRGIRAGLIEGSNIWLSVGAIAWLFRFLTRRQPARVTVERLRLGESVLVTHVAAPPRGRRARRKLARKAAKLEARREKRGSGRRSGRRSGHRPGRAHRGQEAAGERLSGQDGEERES